MKKFNIVLLVFLMIGLLGASPVYAAENNGSSSSQMSNQQSMESNSFHANDLIGKTVKNQQGEELGKVEDIMMQNDGTATFVILSRGGALGVGEKYYPIPFKTFTSEVTNLAKVDSDRDLTANLDKSKLESGPNFTDKKAMETAAKDWQNKVCSYYKAQCRFL